MITEKFLIGAISRNGVYGLGRKGEGKLPWESKVDMGFFKNTTKTHDVAMTSGMWESLPSKFRPLPGRGNIIITSQKDYKITDEQKEKGVIIVHSPQEAIQVSTASKLFFSGGPELWESAKDLVDVLLINVIDLDVIVPEGVDAVLFPHLLDPTKLWPDFLIEDRHTETETKDGESSFKIEFCRYVRQ